MLDLAGPVAVLFNELDRESQSAFVAEFTQKVESMSSGPKVAMRGTTWIASGRKRA